MKENGNKTGKLKWLQSALVVGIITTILGFGLAYWNNWIFAPDDFIITLNSLQDTIKQDNQHFVQIDINENKNYDGNVSLTIGKKIDGIKVSFTPATGQPNFSSTMNVEVSTAVIPDFYQLEILALGASGEKHSLIYSINVVSPPFQSVLLNGMFFPDGWMGDIKSIELDDNYNDPTAVNGKCMKIDYTPKSPQSWAGIQWMPADSDWGSNPNSHNLTGATTLTFKAKAQKQGAKAEFKIGGVKGAYKDSFFPAKSTGVIVLKNTWQEYEIDLTNKDLGNLIGGFCWVTNKEQNPNGCTIFLDDINFK